MERLPSPYDRDVRLDTDEEFVACWRAVPVRLTEAGSLEPLVVKGRSRAVDPTLGLLVLTTQRIRHYREYGTRGAFGDLQADAQADLAIPLRVVVGLDLRRAPGGGRPLLVVQMQDPGDASDRGAPGPSGAGSKAAVYFLLDPREDADDTLADIEETAEAGGARLGNRAASPVATPPGGADGTEGPEEGPIHFHAEQEPE